MTKLLLLLLLFSTNLLATETTEIYCKYKYSGGDIVRLINIQPGTERMMPSCFSDLVWSSERNQKDVCFTGDAQEVADMMNNEELDQTNWGYLFREAEVENDIVYYQSVDQKNFHVNYDRLITRCRGTLF